MCGQARPRQPPGSRRPRPVPPSSALGGWRSPVGRSSARTRRRAKRILSPRLKSLKPRRFASRPSSLLDPIDRAGRRARSMRRFQRGQPGGAGGEQRVSPLAGVHRWGRVHAVSATGPALTAPSVSSSRASTTAGPRRADLDAQAAVQSRGDRGAAGAFPTCRTGFLRHAQAVDGQPQRSAATPSAAPSTASRHDTLAVGGALRNRPTNAHARRLRAPPTDASAGRGWQLTRAPVGGGSAREQALLVSRAAARCPARSPWPRSLRRRPCASLRRRASLRRLSSPLGGRRPALR